MTFFVSPTLNRIKCQLVSKASITSCRVRQKKGGFREQRRGSRSQQKKLEGAYPKLKAGGGFELLRSGIGSSLAFLPPPATGYSVPYLRDQVGLEQALAYLRPLQMELDVSPVLNDMVGTNGIS